MKLKENQAQEDGFGSIKRLTRENVVGTEYTRVERHVVEEKDRKKLTFGELQDDKANELANKTLRF